MARNDGVGDYSLTSLDCALFLCHYGVVKTVMCQPVMALDARIPQGGVLVAAEREHRLVHLLGVEHP